MDKITHYRAIVRELIQGKFGFSTMARKMAHVVANSVNRRTSGG